MLDGSSRNPVAHCNLYEKKYVGCSAGLVIAPSLSRREPRQASTTQAEIAISIDAVAPARERPRKLKPDHLAMMGAPIQLAVALLERRRCRYESSRSLFPIPFFFRLGCPLPVVIRLRKLS